MSINTLTWNYITQTPTIAGATATAQEMLNGIQNLINASTYWGKTKTFSVDKGTIELKPLSTDVDVKDGRCLFAISDGVIGAAAPNERPSTANRLAPHNTATSALVAKQWVGFSPNAATTGPATDVWTSTSSPYTTWSKLIPMNASRMSSGRKMGIIESAEIICVWWEGNSADTLQFFCFGRLVVNDDGVSANWGLFTSETLTDTTAVTTVGWDTNSNIWGSSGSGNGGGSPIGAGHLQHSAGAARRSHGLMYNNANTILYGIGRTFSTLTSATSGQDLGYSSSNAVRLIPITVAGGTYTGGSQNDGLGELRQIKLGPAAYRGQTIVASSITQAICFNWHSSVTTRGGLWFDNYA